jgi:hypothetical protein
VIKINVAAGERNPVILGGPINIMNMTADESGGDGGEVLCVIKQA